MFSQPATLELTHNWGTENDDNYKNATGNEDPKGYGELAGVLLVPEELISVVLPSASMIS